MHSGAGPNRKGLEKSISGDFKSMGQFELCGFVIVPTRGELLINK